MRRAVVAILAVVVHAGSAPAGYSYEVAIIDGPGCGLFRPDYVEPGGINDLGEVVGTIRFCGKTDEEHAFFWSPEAGLQVLGNLPDSAYTKGAGISNSGLILLEWTGSPTAGGYTGAMIDGDTIVDLPPTPGGTNSLAFAIRDDGLAVGECGNTLVGPYPLPCVWVDGVPESLAEKFGFPLGSALAVNAMGVIAGWGGTAKLVDGIPLLFEPSRLRFLPNVEESKWATATAVNDFGDAAGWTHIKLSQGTTTRALIWMDDGLAVVPPLSGNSRSAANAMNAWGMVVGNSWAGAPPNRAFMWNCGALIDVQVDLVPPGSRAFVNSAVDVNNRGQILCRGSMDSHPIAVVLTPIGVLPGDVNMDAKIDSQDLALVVEAWGLPPQADRSWADVNSDAVIDGADLGEVLARFGTVATR